MEKFYLCSFTHTPYFDNLIDYGGANMKEEIKFGDLSTPLQIFVVLTWILIGLNVAWFLVWFAIGFIGG